MINKNRIYNSVKKEPKQLTYYQTLRIEKLKKFVLGGSKG